MNMKLSSFAVGLCVLLAVHLPNASSEELRTPEDWTQFRGPDGQGTSRSKGLPTTWSETQHLPWKTELPGPGSSSPVVWRDRVYLTCYTGHAMPGSSEGNVGALKRHVLCVDGPSGRILWNKDVAAAQPEEAKVRDHGYASSTPVVDGDRLYVFFGKSGVFAFDHNGRQIWHADVGSKTHGWGSAASPVLFKELLIINAAVESESLIALNRQTGEEVWRTGGMKESWNTPILVPVKGGGKELVVAIAGKVLGLDPSTGDQLWSCDTGIGWYMVPSLVNQDDVVYCIGGRSGGSLAVRAGGRGDVTRSHRLWTLTKGSNVSSPILHDGHLYFLHENTGVLYCIKGADGKLVFEERLANAGQFYSSPILVDGKLYAVGRNGAVFVLSGRPRFEQLARNDMRDGSEFDASPAVYGDRLLIRSEKFLYCVGD